MPDTLKAPLFDMAHLDQGDVAGLRGELPPSAPAATRRLTPWAVGLVMIVVAGLVVARRLGKA